MPMPAILRSSGIVFYLLSHLYPIFSAEPNRISLEDGGWVQGQIVEQSQNGLVIRYEAARIPAHWVTRFIDDPPIPHVLSPGNRVYSVVELTDGLTMYGIVEVLPASVVISHSQYFEGQRRIAKTSIAAIRPLDHGKIICRDNLSLTGYIKSRGPDFVELMYSQSTLFLPNRFLQSKGGQVSRTKEMPSNFFMLSDRFGNLGIEAGISAYGVYGPLAPKLDAGYAGRVTLWLPLDESAGWFFGLSAGYFRMSGQSSTISGSPIFAALSVTKPFGHGWGWTVSLGLGPGLETIEEGQLIARQWALMAFGQVAVTWLMSSRVSLSLGVESFHDYDPGEILSSVGPVLSSGFRL